VNIIALSLKDAFLERWRKRPSHLLLRSLAAGVITFLLEWAGFNFPHRVRMQRLPFWGTPRSLADIWWHLPSWIALFFVLGAAGYRGRSRRGWGPFRRQNDDDEPTTLGL
jgi:hypothetical protein